MKISLYFLILWWLEGSQVSAWPRISQSKTELQNPQYFKRPYKADDINDELIKRDLMLEKRVEPLAPQDDRDWVVVEKMALPDGLYPSFILKNENLVRFFSDPIHYAQYREVYDPHLPGYPILPQPLLPAPTDELRDLYKKALHYYEEDQTLSDVWKRRREARRQVTNMDWAKGHPCYCNLELCADHDMMLKSYLDFGWWAGQEAARVHAVQQAELLGMIDLGERLTVELNGGLAPI